ncbi:AraC family transcriptional regulator [Paenibacillus algorifonticola]|uniref:iron-hydroxamate ABC transporter substrate-binding protein n=1 Tax=Paenibacillus algorifonticola TaxID=684063 RepID=UPI003D2A69F6
MEVTNDKINVDEQLYWFTHSAIKVMDVRHIKMKLGEALSSYRLPSNAFLFGLRGSAAVALDNREYAFKKFQILHGGKGFYLDIRQVEEPFEYYLLLYKTVQPFLNMPDKQRLLEKNPFRMQYGVTPAFPISLYEKLKQLDEEFHKDGKLAGLHVKTLFYHFIYELLRQLEEQEVSVIKADLVAQAIRYIHEHYAEVITLERLANVLDCTPRHLTRLFKNQIQHSPIDYLIQLRIEKAKVLLTSTEGTLQEIAAGVGYPDVYFFSRIFKKHTGISPIHYKTEASAPRKRPYNPLLMSRYPIVSRRRSGHTVIGDNHYQNRGEGVLRMNRGSKQSMAIIMLLAMTLLVSACGSSANSPATNGTAPAASSHSAEQTASERILKDGLGNEVKVPANPKRVIASYLEDHLVALGVIPVAQWSVSEGKVQNYLQKELANIPAIPSELPYEVVMSYQPDLIIIDNAEMVMGDKYAQYAKIAPTYTVGSDVNNDWRQELLTIGEVLNKSEEAKQVLADYEAKATDAKNKLHQAIGDKSAAVLWVTAKNVYVVNQNLSSGDLLYRDLGLTVPNVVAEISSTAKANWSAISKEKLAELDADYLFIVNSREATKEEILSDPIWQGIPAVKNNNVYAYDNNASWLYTGTIANSQMIDDVLESIVK